MSAAGYIGRGCPRVSRAASRTRISTRSSPGCRRTGIVLWWLVLRVHGGAGLGTVVGDGGRGGSGPAADYRGTQGYSGTAAGPGVQRRVRVAAAVPGGDAGADPGRSPVPAVVDVAPGANRCDAQLPPLLAWERSDHLELELLVKAPGRAKPVSQSRQRAQIWSGWSGSGSGGAGAPVVSS